MIQVYFIWLVSCLPAMFVHSCFRLHLWLFFRFERVLSFKGSASQKHQRQRWTKRPNKHTRFSEKDGDTQAKISTSLQKVASVNWTHIWFDCWKYIAGWYCWAAMLDISNITTGSCTDMHLWDKNLNLTSWEIQCSVCLSLSLHCLIPFSSFFVTQQQCNNVSSSTNHTMWKLHQWIKCIVIKQHNSHGMKVADKINKIIFYVCFTGPEFP